MNDIPEVSPELFGGSHWSWRRHWWIQRTRAAEWNIPEGPVGKLVLQQRRRGQIANLRAVWILAALIATILVGLAYYIGVPVWEQYFDGRRQTYEDQIAGAEKRALALNPRREKLRDDIVAALSPMAEIIIPGSDTPREGMVTLPEGGTVIVWRFDGTIFRSNENGTIWNSNPLGVDINPTGMIAVPSGKELIAWGIGGRIARSIDRGANWHLVESGIPSPLNGILTLPETETLVGWGSGGLITRSTDGGENWLPSSSGTAQYLVGMIAMRDGKTLFAWDFDGVTIYSVDSGANWQLIQLSPDAAAHESCTLLGVEIPRRPVEYGSTIADLNVDLFRLEGMSFDQRILRFLALEDGESLVGWSAGGEMCIFSYANAKWELKRVNPRQAIDGMLVSPDAKSLIAWGGTIIRSFDNGTNWQKTFDVTQYVNGMAMLPDGNTLIAWGGDILRSSDFGGSWQESKSGLSGGIEGLFAMPDGRTLIAWNFSGAMSLSIDAGVNWRPMPSGIDNAIISISALADNKAALAIEGNGHVLRISDDSAKILASLDISSTAPPDKETGLSPLKSFWGKLPEYVKIFPGHELIRAEFKAIDDEDERIFAEANAAQEKLADIDNGTFDSSEKQAAFETFFDSCRDNAPSSEQTKACTEAWTAQQLSEAQTWWQTLAVSVPQGILLLFLLATLSGLYRYNLRVAGFHHSRADALELLATSPAATDIDTFVKLADTLASDKVAWGKGNTPADQAMEIIKALVSRKAV